MSHCGAAADAITGDAYPQPIAHASTNLHSLFGTWAADAFSLLRHVRGHEKVPTGGQVEVSGFG